METLSFQSLSEFVVLEELASGNCARFLKAKHVASDIIYVLKRVLQGATNSFRRQRAEAEVQHLAAFRDFPGIIRCLGSFKEKDDLYLILEFEEEWKSVRSVANANASTRPDGMSVLGSSDLAVFTIEMVRILELMHTHNPPIIHRDIKPENIFCVYTHDRPKYRGFKYKLSDFGSSVTTSEATVSFSSGYTRPYMAPEVAMFLDGHTPGDNGVDPITTKTDMWNFGATLLDLAVNSDVFDPSKASGAAIRAKIRNGTFQLKEDVLMRLPSEGRKRWDNLNPFVQEVIIQCLRVKVSERPSAAAIRNSAPYKVAKHLCRSFYEDIVLLKTQLTAKALAPSVSDSSTEGDEMRTYSIRIAPPDADGKGDKKEQDTETPRDAVVRLAAIDKLFTASICGKADAFLELQQLASMRNKHQQLLYPLATALLMCIFATGGNSIPKDMSKAQELADDVLLWLRSPQAPPSSQEEDTTKYREYVWSICYHRGLGVARDGNQVMEHLKASAAAGYIPSINNLGVLKYSNPHATNEDMMEAYAMFTRCALDEYPPGYYSMGLVYEDRRVFPAFTAYRSMAFQYYLASAKYGYLPAMTKAALGYYHGYDNGVVDYEQAVYYFKNAAVHGDAVAQYHLGLCYELGHGVTVEATEAYRWFEASAAQDNMQAQFKLGMCLLEGQGTHKNVVDAAKWLHLSAQKGYAEAKSALLHHKL